MFTSLLQALSTVRDGKQAAMLKGHSVVTMNVRQTQAFLCDTEGSYTVAMYRLKPTLTFLKNVYFVLDLKMVLGLRSVLLKRTRRRF